jgi:hypothetical protein
LKDEHHQIDVKKMQMAHARLDFNFEDFFVMKYIIYNVMMDLEVNLETIQKVLEKIERYKWGMDVREHTF